MALAKILLSDICFKLKYCADKTKDKKIIDNKTHI
jgi:hypothetical protein